ncbi:MAG TPA: SH3 domain-containing protein, partial [Anaerolineales bacterium]|nr:SH3 domain-containing protein [Anaerolineales bacterium]
TVREQTNCRAGPGQDYEVVFTYLPNAKLEIVGNYGIENYWLVKSNESLTGQCWLWGEYVEVSGSYWAVSSVTPPPTSTQPPPNAPTFQSWDYTCTFNGINNDLNVILTWSDKSNNETGYRVFRDGGLVAELPAGSATYADKIAVNSGQGVGYRVEAYNVTGTASTSTISITCP